MTTVQEGATGYDQGVERLADYLWSLPDRARRMWIDAAYDVYLVSKFESEAEQPVVQSQQN